MLAREAEAPVAAAGRLERRRLLPFSARALFLLVLCVTPANFLMFSHGATMPGIVEGPLPLPWHAARFVAQVSVLSVLLTLSSWDAADEQLAVGADERASDAPTERRRAPRRSPRMSM